MSDSLSSLVSPLKGLTLSPSFGSLRSFGRVNITSGWTGEVNIAVASGVAKGLVSAGGQESIDIGSIRVRVRDSGSVSSESCSIRLVRDSKVRLCCVKVATTAVSACCWLSMVRVTIW